MRLRVLTRFPQAREQSSPYAQKSVARPLKWHILPVGTWPIRQELPRATAVAERKRSRSEADTGRRTGASCGLCLFFGLENRLRFSSRAGPSMGLRFGQWIGLSCWPGFGHCSCDPLGRAVRRHPTRRAATRRSSLRLRWRRTTLTRCARGRTSQNGGR